MRELLISKKFREIADACGAVLMVEWHNWDFIQAQFHMP